MKSLRARIAEDAYRKFAPGMLCSIDVDYLYVSTLMNDVRKIYVKKDSVFVVVHIEKTETGAYWLTLCGTDAMGFMGIMGIKSV